MQEEMEMDSKEAKRLQRIWDARLEAEGLGVIDVAPLPQGADYNHIKGKWRRLEAELNGVSPSNKKLLMLHSPQTARAMETPRYEGSKPPSDLHSEDPDDFGDTVWDNLINSFSASPLEARIADRRRGSICGLDHENRPVPLKIKRKHREPGKAWRKRILDHIMGNTATDEDGPRFSEWVSQQMPPYAHSDAGNGPLSIVDVEEPAYQWVASCEANWALEPEETEAETKAEEVRMSPIVDTMTYPPGRGPYQRSLIAQSNSDITG